ncbi:YhgE/Pip domain-containing protein [Limosilactobacillus sp.]|jgi:putative membrane protein|uniref:YhgE/Pip domain-containing protein n=1 Tax=Limosilactobacillus sp. TaxID=2773925 RepID=UPI0025B96B51|nr:YhgE/Pip domain-containing protein [Limosilactobacillus sp.]MCH3921388.1 YhgE/Pip domain-containing protein [Limosilactobacillus sp.]MCH3928159.1 YhgE/Pip domain-containing protein [Limosilactobacillus sp.]
MWEMIKQEFKNIYHNKILLVSTVVICIIPFLYSIFFLKSVWDPYGSTGDLPVAVVNKDVPVEYQGKTMAVGDQTVDNLKHNHSLKWEFVSAKKAHEGMTHRKYYTVVTIPKNFSKNATTVMDKHPKTMKLKYETNDSLNMIGEVISETGMTRLNTKVRAAVTNAYASAMFKELHVVGKGMNTAASGAKQLSTGMVSLSDGVNQYVVGVSQVNAGVQQLKVGVTPLASGAAQLASGSQTLASGILQYTAGVSQLGSGVSQLIANSGTLNSGAGQLSSGIGQFSSGVNSLNSGLGTLDSKGEELNTGAGRIATGASQFNSQVNSMLPGIQSQMTQMSGNVEQNANALKSALAPLASSTSSLTQLSSQLGQLSSQLGQLQQAASQGQSQSSTSQTTTNDSAASSINAAKSQLSGIDTSNMSDADKTKLSSAINDLNGADTSSKTTTTSSNNNANSNLAQNIGKLKSEVDQLQAAVDKSAATSGQNAQQVMTAANGLEQSLNSMKTGSNQALSNISSQLTSATSSLVNYTNQLNSGVNEYTAGVHTAAAGSAKLAASTGTLQSGANQLAAGISQYTAGVSQVGSGVSQLNANSGQLNSGAAQLASALTQLNAKVPTLVAGINQLASGTQQLQDNSPALISGIAKLNAGSTKLSKALGKGAKTINGIKVSGRNAKMFAAPTTLHHKHYSYVPNYGHALAPYVLSVALYVGMLVFNFVYPIRREAMPGHSATAWWLSKVVIGLTAATTMAVVECGIMMACGLTVDHAPSFFLTTILFGWASMAIVMFLSMTFDNPGRFVAMVLLMLQLGGSGGTFPMEITMKFYNVIHWFLPMTYSIQGLRQSISSGLGTHYAMFCNSVLLGIAVAFFLLLWLSMKGIHSHALNLFPRLDREQKFMDKAQTKGIDSDDDNK